MAETVSIEFPDTPEMSLALMHLWHEAINEAAFCLGYDKECIGRTGVTDFDRRNAKAYLAAAKAMATAIGDKARFLEEARKRSIDLEILGGTMSNVTVFQTVLKLRENDEASDRLMEIVGAMVQKDGQRTLGAGGGYIHGRPEPEDDYMIVFCFQKNDDETGDLVPVTEADRTQIFESLSTHSYVEGFLIGPIHPDGLPDWEVREASLIQAFRDGQRGYLG